ncbi:MAG: DUF1801 domain-containing protein [Saprospiraceae bacterium]|nr:DUF1801 domain-containing protein [Saprospiraceae bacterium]HMW39949.1 DUF1801 domain-containing protein [Saprospiraceae bacterium]HMX89364.1 DUF1801 domain-containing protein [Saprospiraceae bacterium]HMZ41018.1 DUF1801 domain-containing protein [Saprospiraceae bacterium]HNA65371.1 DUF1801 domain-containing protein [Saprospiraceae bacterium]
MLKCNTIDEYIEQTPKDVQIILRKVRKLISELAPEASEKMAYGLATFYLNGNLVHFGAMKNHLGFYPSPSGIKAFEKELEGKYMYSKGAIQFPYDQEIPYELIGRITRFRIKENRSKD